MRGTVHYVKMVREFRTSRVFPKAGASDMVFACGGAYWSHFLNIHSFEVTLNGRGAKGSKEVRLIFRFPYSLEGFPKKLSN